jgi:hypothetical protein
MLMVRPVYLFGAAAAGLLLAVATLPFLASADTQTSNTNVDLTINSVMITYTSGPTVTLAAINPTAGGRQSTNDDTVTGDTNDSAGFSVTLQETSATSTALISGANTIATSAGTPAAPVTLAADTWGWRMDSVAGFGAGPTSALSSAAPSALKYAAIPANGSPYQIEATSGTGSASVSVWYSADVDTAQPTGAYSTTVTYTFQTL